MAHGGCRRGPAGVRKTVTVQLQGARMQRLDLELTLDSRAAWLGERWQQLGVRTGEKRSIQRVCGVCVWKRGSASVWSERVLCSRMRGRWLACPRVHAETATTTTEYDREGEAAHREEAHNKVNTQHKNMTRCSTKYDARQVYMMQTMARDDAHKNNTNQQV